MFSSVYQCDGHRVELVVDDWNLRLQLVHPARDGRLCPVVHREPLLCPLYQLSWDKHNVRQRTKLRSLGPKNAIYENI